MLEALLKKLAEIIIANTPEEKDGRHYINLPMWVPVTRYNEYIGDDETNEYLLPPLLASEDEGVFLDNEDKFELSELEPNIVKGIITEVRKKFGLSQE